MRLESLFLSLSFILDIVPSIQTISAPRAMSGGDDQEDTNRPSLSIRQSPPILGDRALEEGRRGGKVMYGRPHHQSPALDYYYYYVILLRTPWVFDAMGDK